MRLFHRRLRRGWLLPLGWSALPLLLSGIPGQHWALGAEEVRAPTMAEGPQIRLPGDDDDHYQEEEEEEESSDEEDYDDFFLRTYTFDEDPDQDCRDSPSFLIDCEQVQADGLCESPQKDLFSLREECPVTCGLCPKGPPSITSIWTDHDCYDSGEDVHVYFQHPDPLPDDYVAIFPAYHHLIVGTTIPEDSYEAWLYTCGNTPCRSAYGGLIFGARGQDPHTEWVHFPLSEGRYRIGLLRHTGTLLAVSEAVSALGPDHLCQEGCREQVAPNEVCYEFLEPIHLTYATCAPEAGDRIGLYRADDPRDHPPLVSLEACPPSDETCNPTHHVVSLDGKDPHHHSSWPLSPGIYQAVLLRGESQGQVVSQSETFAVLSKGEICEVEEEEEDEEEL